MSGVSPAPRRVVVVGAGLAGLSAALHLRGAGCEVTVLERGRGPGGRAAGVELDGPSGRFRLDTGPTVLTLPEVAEDAVAAVGDRLADRVDLVPLDPAYRARFADGSRLDVSPDPEVMAARVAELAGPDEAEAYRRWTRHLAAMFRVEQRAFIDRNVDSPLGLLGPDLLRLLALGGFGRLGRAVERTFADDRLRRVFSFQALYAGLSPARALALYAVISYLDLVHGVVYPRGGVAALPLALAGAAADAGVELRYDEPVVGVDRLGDRVRGVVTPGAVVPADAVVLTTELPEAARLLGRAVTRRPVRHSPSCVLLAGGTSGWSPPEADQPHHTIAFGRAWDGVFADLESGRPMRDPSVLFSLPTVTDPGLAPPRGHSAYVLLPAPNLETGPDAAYWDRVRGPFREHLLTAAERVAPGLGPALEVEELLTPADWARRGMAAGTPFSAAHTVTQTGPWRTGNVLAPGVVLAGSGTVPGVGVPMVLVSGRLAAERLTGPRPGYRSLAWS